MVYCMIPINHAVPCSRGKFRIKTAARGEINAKNEHGRPKNTTINPNLPQVSSAFRKLTSIANSHLADEFSSSTQDISLILTISGTTYVQIRLLGSQIHKFVNKTSKYCFKHNVLMPK